MAIQQINIGSAPNQGGGDTIREAFRITNENFAELYTLYQSLYSALQITGTQTAIDSFTISSTGATNTYSNDLVVEKYTTVNDIYIKWSMSRHPSQIVVQKIINNATQIAYPLVAVGQPDNYSDHYSSLNLLNNDQTWTLQVSGPLINNVPLFVLTKQIHLYFRLKTYSGVSNSSSITDAELTGVTFNSGYAVSDVKLTTTYDCTGSQQTPGRFIYYAYPKSFGLLSDIKVNDIYFSDYDVTERNLMINNTQNEEAYYVYRFTNRQYGSNVRVIWQ